MWIAFSILSVSIFMIISSRCYIKLNSRMKIVTTELVLIPFRLKDSLSLIKDFGHIFLVSKQLTPPGLMQAGQQELEYQAT